MSGAILSRPKCYSIAEGRFCPIGKMECPGECIFSDILDNIGLGIIVLDVSNRKIIFQNRIASTLFQGIEPDNYERISSLLLTNLEECMRPHYQSAPLSLSYGGKFIGYTIYHTVEGFLWLFLADISEKLETVNALRASEERYRLLASNAEDVIWTTDTDFHLNYISPSVKRLRGYTAEETIRQTGMDILTPASLDTLKRIFTKDIQIIDSLVMQRLVEAELTCKDGSTVWTETRLTAFYDQDGLPMGVLGVTRDITDRKRSEDKLKHIYQMTKEILEKSPYGIFVVNETGAVDYINPAMLSISGDTLEEISKLNVFDLPEYKRTGVGEKIKAAIFTGEPFFLGPVTFTSYSGVKTTIRNFTGIPLGESGRKTALVFVEDVTERMKAEEENARLAAAVESAAEHIVITDPEGVIQYVNPAFEKITGYSKEEVIGKKPNVLKSGRHNEEFYKQLWDTLKMGESWQGHFINRKKDGSLFEEDAIISPVRNGGGRIVNYVAVKRDITEKAKLEAIAEAVTTINNTGYIFSGIRHEIGNPINSIKVTMSVLKNKLADYHDASVRDYVDRALNEIARVEYLLTALKNFNMYESKNLANVNVPIFFDKFMHLVEKDFDQKGIRLKAIIHPEVQWICADQRALHQVLLNILANASDALEGCEDPSIIISVFRLAGSITMRIIDNGCGISDEHQKDLFKPFYTSKESGTGLGLVIARKMMLQMNGNIEIMSERNAGTIVDLLIPEGHDANS